MSKFLRYAAVGAAMASFGIASAAQAGTTDSANATAQILTALAVKVDTTANTLNFGTIADGGLTANQSVTVDTTGTVTAGCAAGSKLVCGGTTAAPLFHVTGLASKLVNISFVNTNETLSFVGTAPSGFVSAMTATNFVTDASANQVNLGLSGTADFKVGGTLVVQPNMAPGVYTGTVSVSVAYN